jgi:hypothetical protein
MNDRLLETLPRRRFENHPRLERLQEQSHQTGQAAVQSRAT